MKTFLAHLKYWGEIYKAAPIVIFLLIASTWIINRYLGTDSAEDIGSIVGSNIELVRFVLLVIVATLTQRFAYGYEVDADIKRDGRPSTASKVIDSCVTSFLLLLLSAIVFGWLK